MLMSLVKRFLPFIVTLALGLFIASFFVSLKPSLLPTKFERRYQYKKSCWNNKSQFERENRRRDFDQREMRDELRFNRGEIDFDAVTPVAPAAPTVPRNMR